jgi:hypothetical protein
MKKALLIGINYIGTNAELRGCINDVINIKKFLINDYGFTEDEIVMLTETSRKKYPSRENIIKYMKWLVQDNDENSRLFIHYSGHGSYTIDRNGDERDGRDETICPVDYSTKGMIVDDELKKILVNPLKKGAKLTCLFDCCHSGTVLDLRCNYKMAINNRRNSYTIDIDNHYKSTVGDVMLFSGCQDRQTSADAYEEGTNQGAMTYSFLKMIEKLKNKNKTPTVQNIMKNLSFFIKARGYTQTPQLSTGKLIDLNQKFNIC